MCIPDFRNQLDVERISNCSKSVRVLTEPFSSALPNKAVGGARPKEKSVEPTRPDHEEWFHGPLTRHQVNNLNTFHYSTSSSRINART